MVSASCSLTFFGAGPKYHSCLGQKPSYLGFDPDICGGAQGLNEELAARERALRRAAKERAEREAALDTLRADLEDAVGAAAEAEARLGAERQGRQDMARRLLNEQVARSTARPCTCLPAYFRKHRVRLRSVPVHTNRPQSYSAPHCSSFVGETYSRVA